MSRFKREYFKIVAIIVLFIGTIYSCKTKYITVEKEVPIETIKTKYQTNIKYDSIYIHDSINTYILGDTIFKNKIKIVYKAIKNTDSIIVRDTITKPIYITKTKTVENRVSAFDRLLMFGGLYLLIGMILATIAYVLKNKIFKI